MQDVSLVHAIEQTARRTPGALALSWRRSTWTYGDLARAIECVRNALLQRQCGPAARIALLIRNSPQYIAAYFGALSAGCAVVPLNVQERANLLARQIAHAECSLVLADSGHPEWQSLSSASEGAGIEHVAISMRDDSDSLDAFCATFGAAPSAEPPAFDADQLAMIIYTSGTTGRPKGVMLSHANLRANACAIADYLGIVASDKALCVLPFHFSYGSSVLNSNLLAGAHLVLEDNFAFPQAILRRMQDERITAFSGVPATFALLLGRCRLQEFDLSHLRYVTQAGGAMPRAQIAQLRSVLPHTRVFIMYGQTEATARLTYLDPAQLETRLGSVGRPLQGIDIEIRDADGRISEPNQIGEIYARGPSVMLGYWRDPELSSQVLVDGWLRTGDLGHRDADDYIYIDARAVEMIKVGAFRVSPQEVEEVLVGYPGVQEVAVTAVPDEVLGQAVKAVLVMREDATADLLGVKAHCRQHLASYKVPKIVEFATSLPRTSSGKIQRYKLA